MMKEVNYKAILFNYFLLIFIIILTSTLNTSADNKEFDKNEWEKITKGLDYNETADEVNKEEKNEGKGDGDGKWNEPSKSWKLPVFKINNQLLTILLIIIGIAVLTFIILKLLPGNVLGRRRKETELSSLDEDIDENLMESDLEKALRQALEKKMYRLAVRIYFLMVIQALSEKNHIKWKKDKTNFEYLREMSKNDNYQKFFQTTIAYERIWYGEKNIDEAVFNQVSKLYINYLKSINK